MKVTLFDIFQEQLFSTGFHLGDVSTVYELYYNTFRLMDDKHASIYLWDIKFNYDRGISTWYYDFEQSVKEQRKRDSFHGILWYAMSHDNDGLLKSLLKKTFDICIKKN
jgi:hypothetical protein